MAQPPAWLRHQAVEASARAMVSMTWKKVTGSVSIPFDERGSSRRNSRASCSLSSSAGGSRRVLSISFDAAATAGAHRLGARNHAPGRPQDRRKSGSACPRLRLSHRGRGSVQIGRDGQFAGRSARSTCPWSRFRRNNTPLRPSGTSSRDRRKAVGICGKRHVGLEVVAGAHDQGEADRPDDLADAAEAIGRAHAATS